MVERHSSVPSSPFDASDHQRFGRAFVLSAEGSVERQIIEAAKQHAAEHGWAATTMDDLAAASSLSRATIYRAFPGGRETVIEAVRRHSVLEFFHELQPVLESSGELVDAISTTMVTAVQMLDDDEQLQRELEQDPGQVLPAISFRGVDRIVVVARVFMAPSLMAFVSRRDANRAAEWAARMVLSYYFDPSPHLDLRDAAAVATFVRRRLVPGLASNPLSSDPRHQELI